MSQSTWDMMTPQQRADCTDAGRAPGQKLFEMHGTMTGRIPTAKKQEDNPAGGGESEDEYEDSKPGPLDEDEDEDSLEDFLDEDDEDMEIEVDDSDDDGN